MMSKLSMNKIKNNNKTLLMYDGDGRYTFLNATIWECIKYWLFTKLTGSDIDDTEQTKRQ